MKTQNKYNNRLIKFAKHLETITQHREHGLYESANLIELAKKTHIVLNVKYQCWIFDELPALFSDWSFDEQTGKPIWDGCNPEEGSTASVIEFLGLRLDEFMHLFDIEGFQNVRKYGGATLNFDSGGPAVANNIFELVKHRNDASKS